MQARFQDSYRRRCCRGGSLFPSFSLWCTPLILIGVLLSASLPLAAAEGRDFAGGYQLSDIVDQDDTVSGTFTARVFNYSDADVSDATVVLDSRLAPGQTYWSFPSVSIVNRGSVRLRCLITIPRAEYNAWQQGARPNLHVDTPNADGTSLRRMVELSRNPVAKGEKNIRTGTSSPVRARAVAELATAQPNTISTYAGGGPVNGPALSINLVSQDVAAAASGDLYFASMHAVYRLSGDLAILIAGTPGLGGFSGDGGPANSATLNYPFGVTVDGSGNVYITDNGNDRIRKVSAETGVITTVAGNGSTGFSGDGGPATSASLNDPFGVAVDGSGNVYITDNGNGRIRKVSVTTGVITTVAGNDTYGFSGDGEPATSASLKNPSGVAVDPSGNLYIADSGNLRIREVFATTGIIDTVAGNGSYGFRGDGGPATSARLAGPSGVAVDTSGNFYVADGQNDRVRKVDHRIPTPTLLTSNANPTTTQNLVLTAAISPGDATGSVQFFDGFTALRSVAVSAGTATLFDLLLTAGTHSLVAVYSGDTNHAMSTSAALVQVVSSWATSTITLTSNGQPTQSNGQTVYVSMLNSPATFTATLAPVTASGTVQFFDGATRLGMQTVSGGTAVFTTSTLSAGNHTITAVYGGDGFFMPRWAAPLTQQVRETVSQNNVNSSMSSR